MIGRCKVLMRCLAFASAFAYSAHSTEAQETSPQLISAEMTEVKSYLYPKITLYQQSGERLIIDALLLGKIRSDATDEEWIEPKVDFAFNVPVSQQNNRICVDIANSKIGFRKLSLMRLLKPVTSVTAKIDSPTDLGAGTLIVAYPTTSNADDPQVACISGHNWIYPIAARDAEESRTDGTLQLRLNTGGEDARVARVNRDGIAFGEAQTCERTSDASGLYSRTCRITLSGAENNYGIQVVVARRNGGSSRRVFNLSVRDE